ncbi:hypothetical protein GCM10027217_25600 [Pseudomaricurvus hydrocarbonicus]
MPAEDECEEKDHKVLYYDLINRSGFKIQKFKNSKIQKFKNSKIQKFKNSKIQQELSYV